MVERSRRGPEFEPQPRELPLPDARRDRAAQALGATATAREVQGPAAARAQGIEQALGRRAVAEASRDRTRER